MKCDKKNKNKTQFFFNFCWSVRTGLTVVKWTPENEKVFVVVKCNYVTVGLKVEK
jgi:hypothetical protein